MKRIESQHIGVVGAWLLLATLLLAPSAAFPCSPELGYEQNQHSDWAEVWVEGENQGWLSARLSPAAIRAKRRLGKKSQPFGNELRKSDQWSMLNSHGDWKNTRRWGWVWTPSKKAREWRPYLNGRWLWTDAGWHFAGHEPFAEMVYHHGRWYRHRSYGWVWVPGAEKAPSWVVWRFGGGYVGWAPLGPSEDDLFPEGKRHDAWVFVRNDRFFSSQLGDVALSIRENRSALDRSGFVGGRNRRSSDQYHPGPKPSRLRRFTGVIPSMELHALSPRRVLKPRIKLKAAQLIPQLRSRRLTLRQPAFVQSMRVRLPVDRLLPRQQIHPHRIYKGKKLKKLKKVLKKKQRNKKKLHKKNKKIQRKQKAKKKSRMR